MIDIIAPTALRSNGGTWDGTTWMQLDVDRVDFTINNQVEVYNQIDQETSGDQFKASTHALIITGHITADSELEGANVFTKAKNLILAGREWYVDLTAGASGFPQVRWNNQTWDFLFQKVAVIDNAANDDVIMNYQIGLILPHDTGV